MRLRFKIPLFGVLTIAALIVIGLVLLYRSHILENWVNRYLADRVAAQYNLDITIAEIDGSFLKGFVLRDVLLRSHREADTVTLAYLPRISIGYSVSNLWHLRWVIDSLHFTQPHLFIKQDTTGAWILPELPDPARSESRLPSWEVNSIVIDEATLDVILRKKTWHWYDLSLDASVKSEAGTYTIRLDTLRCNSDTAGLRIQHLSGLATLYRQRLALQNINLVTDSSFLVFSLAQDAGDSAWMETIIDSGHVHLPEVLSFFGSSLTGELDVTGSVYRRYGKTGGNLYMSGTFVDRQFDSLMTGFHYDDGILYLDSAHGTILDHCAVNGYGSINFVSKPQAYHLSLDIDSFDLNNLVFESFATDLNGRFEMDGRGFGSTNMVLDLDLDLDESHFDKFHFHGAEGQMTVGHEGLYFFPGFQIWYHRNRFLFDGGVDYSGEIAVSGLADLSDLSNFAHQTFIDLPAGRATAEFSFTGPTDDPNLRARCRSDSLWLYKFFSNDFDASFYVKSFMYGMRGPVVIRSQAGEAWGFPYDSLFSEMKLDSNLLYIDTGYIVNDFSRMAIAGVLDYENYPQRLLLDTVSVDLSRRRFANEGQQVILIDSTGYIFERIAITATEGDLTVSGRADYDESIDINWNINSIAIAPWVRLLSDSLEIEGRLSSVGRARNTLEYPQFSLQAGIDSLKFQSLLLGNLQAFISYQDSTLQIDSSLLRSQQGMYTATGEFPVNLALISGHKLFDDREQDIQIQAVDKQLDLAAFLLESVEYITGDFTAEIDLTGRPIQPHLNGTCSLRDGVIKLIDLQDRLEQVEIELEMSDRLVTVNRAEAIVPRKKGRTPGRVTGGGTILVNDINRFTYALRADCFNLPVNYELGDVSGVADAALRVSGMTPPRVTGTILMPSTYYRESFEETGFSMLSALEADKMWDLDLMVEFPSNFWVKNDDIDAEFSGSVNILRIQGIYNFLGTLEVIRGKYFFLDKTFQITPGGQIIYDNIEKPDPKLDLEITTRIRTPGRFTEFEGEINYSYELALAVTGSLENPIITGAGETPISSEAILPALLADYRPDRDSLGGDPALSDRITIGGMGLLATQFSKIGTRTLGVETFEIYPTGTKGFDPLSTRLTIGAYTLPNLYVFGSSYFDIDKGQEVGAEYRLGRHYLFEGRRDESNLYHFNFKLQWEY